MNRRSSDRPFRARVLCLLALAPVIFILGQCYGRSGSQTVRQAEAAPVPRALPDYIVKFHDAGDEVTCWYADSGLACLPDAVLAGAYERADSLP